MAEPNLPGYATAAAVKTALDKAVASAYPRLSSDDARMSYGNSAAVSFAYGSYVDLVKDKKYTIPRDIYYVSQDATNGFVVGNNSSNGLSQLTAKLTIESALLAASAGDMIVVNDSATPYTAATYYDISKPITLMPYSSFGVTLRATSSSYVIRPNANNVTIGAFIVDTNAVSVSGIQSTVLPCSNLSLIGTKIKAHGSYNIRHIGSCVLSGVRTETAGSGYPKTLLEGKSAGKISIEYCEFDSGAQISPIVDGVHVSLLCTSVVNKNPSAADAIFIRGAKTIIAEHCNFKNISGAASVIPVRVVPDTSLDCESVKFKNCCFSTNKTSSDISAGYGLAVGAESSVSTSVGLVEITDCVANHVNHGFFLGYGCLPGSFIRSSIARDSVIGFIIKGASGCKVSSCIAIGGALTGGALRTKECTGAVFHNNLVIFGADSVAGIGYYSSDSATGADVYNNIFFATGTGKIPIRLLAGCTAQLSTNNYFFESFPVGAFRYDGLDYDTFVEWLAVEPTAINVDPQFVADNDFRLLSTSPMLGAGTNTSNALGFFNENLSSTIGPIAVAVDA